MVVVWPGVNGHVLNGQLLSLALLEWGNPKKAKHIDTEPKKHKTNNALNPNTHTHTHTKKKKNALSRPRPPPKPNRPRRRLPLRALGRFAAAAVAFAEPRLPQPGAREGGLQGG